MKNMQSKKVVLITGSSGGIGQKLVEKFLDNNYFVIAASRTPLSINNENLHNIIYDVNDKNASTNSLFTTFKMYKKLDVAINNAGILRDSLLHTLDNDTIDNVVETNTNSVIRHMRDESRLMLRNKGGAIINIASIVGLDGNIGQVAYSASKAAVIAATKSAAKELAQFGIRVNAIAPGLIDTKMLKSVNQDKIEELSKKIPLLRLGTPEDIANIALFLASSQSSYITGQTIRVDGGLTI